MNISFLNRPVAILLALPVLATCSQAALVLQVGSASVPAGTNLVQIPVTLTGGDQFTDMVGFVQVGDGGPLMGGTAGPVITAISYSGSVWAQVSGGFSTSATISLPAMVYDPNVSLNAAGVYAAGNGLLMTLTLDISGISPGIYEVKLAQSRGPDTAFQKTGQPVPVTVINGALAIGTNLVSRPKLSIRLEADLKATLAFATEAGRKYHVQWTTNLSTSPWIEATNVISGSGSPASWTDPASGPSPNGRRLYRVRMEN